ncbi:transcriptional regulator [Listeria fleischmannii 1991]|uniref:Transcriptional regulator SlyA n=2 Tax=Listeria fleischmannii TaxID=1069827 RepID=A0A2X3GKR6_9LIST|nr:MarR family winged helix-turn-helix transcriptional regulator [Listeria fleischmannii]EMG28778.1 transcriptional regulator [Listeria fleischmannii subsp. fleischmannii LU2006-1]KMT60147.1 transcriptional regulator [Listeria fleischmannii 1991]SQC68818.1 transcriptional regulator SlyA [Listeria fleischmannii subsp. fleischmannii]
MNFNEDGLSEQIHQLNMLQQQYVLRKLRGLSLNSKQARSLNYIFAHPGTIQKGLSTFLGTQDATVTNILKSLETKGLIRREIPADNERQKRLFLTDKGEDSARKIQFFFSELNKAITENLTADEQNEMSVLLEKMGQSLTKEARSES